jgi:hypothetical protein
MTIILFYIVFSYRCKLYLYILNFYFCRLEYFSYNLYLSSMLKRYYYLYYYFRRISGKKWNIIPEDNNISIYMNHLIYNKIVNYIKYIIVYLI